jgi:hypothetical protein
MPACSANFRKARSAASAATLNDRRASSAATASAAHAINASEKDRTRRAFGSGRSGDIRWHGMSGRWRAAGGVEPPPCLKTPQRPFSSMSKRGKFSRGGQG